MSINPTAWLAAWQSPPYPVNTVLSQSPLAPPPGKPYGADDFLPVLMYVLARSNLAEMLLDVEYMMELMDPALQLGEGESPALPGPPFQCQSPSWPQALTCGCIWVSRVRSGRESQSLLLGMAEKSGQPKSLRIHCAIR